MYRETAHWTPVIAKAVRVNELDIINWLNNRGLVRGTSEARNDYLCPTTGLFLFKEQRIAVEFKLIFG